MMKKCVSCLLVCLFLIGLAPLCAQAEAAPRVIVRAGGSFGIALDQKGQIWGWGDNSSGQLGKPKPNRNVYTPEITATELDGSQIADIQCGNVSTLFLLKDGTVYTCGNNNYGQQGQPGKVERVKTPTRIEGLTDIVQVAAGFGQCMALDSSGSVWVWGRNSNGQLGTPDKKGARTPVKLALTDIVDVQCGGKYSMAVAKDGTVWGFGENDYGQLGEGLPLGNQWLPVKLSVSGRFQKIACGGDVAYGLDEDGKVWAWGRNDYWQLGTREVGRYSASPVRVSLPEQLSFVRLVAYNSHVSAMTAEGGVWTWGGVYHGQVGNGKRPWRDVPTVGSPEKGVLDMDVGSLQSLMVDEKGQVYGCGGNEYGQTGGFNRIQYYVGKWTDTGLNLFSGTWEKTANQ